MFCNSLNCLYRYWLVVSIPENHVYCSARFMRGAEQEHGFCWSHGKGTCIPWGVFGIWCQLFIFIVMSMPHLLLRHTAYRNIFGWAKLKTIPFWWGFKLVIIQQADKYASLYATTTLQWFLKKYFCCIVPSYTWTSGCHGPTLKLFNKIPKTYKPSPLKATACATI